MSAPKNLSELTSWNSRWSQLRVAVFGLGVTGFSVADTLIELGAEVLVVASGADELRLKMLDVLGGKFVQHTDEHPVPEELVSFKPELIVVSPGYKPTHPALVWAQTNNIEVWGDIDLAWRVRDKVNPAPWLAITGTNGKTTTVQLTAAMLQEAGMRVAACGNVGTPVLDAIRDPEGFDVLVVELSSYQLHWMREVHPYSSVVLNLADDHIDWHGSFEKYSQAKAQIYNNTQVACVYNKADNRIENMVEQADVIEGARAIGFDLGAPGPSDFGVVEGVLCDRAFVEDRKNTAEEITSLDELHEVGLDAAHLVSNILAASALARSIGVSTSSIHAALQKFKLDAHRNQLIATDSGISWIDDSKATNPHAADASLSAQDSVVWIVGGLLKGVSIDELVHKHAFRLRGAVFIGVDQEPLDAAFARHAPTLPIVRISPTDTSDVMKNAVSAAAQMAQPGDAVVLAPAAASMDQFTDYAHRGNRFAEAVRELTGGEADGDSASH